MAISLSAMAHAVDSCSNFNDKLFVYHNYEECLFVNAIGPRVELLGLLA
jgi:hypothetical protein